MTIQVNNLSKSIGGQPILNHLTFSIKEGEVVGLLGPNGAGKSTLMKTLVGLWSFDEGDINICGIQSENCKMPHKVASVIGYLPENNPLYDDMYIREYLMFMADMQGLTRQQAKERTEELIKQVNLTPMLNKHIGQLSKGYRQRVGLAQALISNPQLLILDEPTTGLDPNQLDEIRALIKKFGRERTIILSTHIMQEVTAVCSRVIIIAAGEIKADINKLSNINLEQTFRTLTND